MQFFMVEGFIPENNRADKSDESHAQHKIERKIYTKSESFNRNLHGKAFFFVSGMAEDKVTIGAICSVSINFDKQLASFLAALELDLNDVSVEEITLKATYKMLRYAHLIHYSDSQDDIFKRFDLDRVVGEFCDIDYGENLIEEENKADIYDEAECIFTNDFLVPELDRIYASKIKQKISGHPVHYMVQTDDKDRRKSMCRLLLKALYANGRLNSKRYCFIDAEPSDSLLPSTYDCLYKSCIGGAVIVRYSDSNSSEGEYETGSVEMIETLCKTMRKYRNRVLTIFCLPRECTNTKEIFYEKLESIGIVELKEELVSGERAECFLKTLAKENGVRTDKKLFAKLEEGKSYLATELNSLYEEWFNAKLINTVFPQYREIKAVNRKEVAAKPKGSAYNELMEMVGIDGAKKVIIQAINYFKAQKIFADKGMKAETPTMHMVFSGNPGTAKTTVARLFAAIMKENGLISRGTLVEVGRGDLVGKYVGWTAPTIQNKFSEAKGGVLFIDEAYSLVDDRNGSFGDEAINTIVQEMENHRKDVVVIFAGYPDKMEEFLNKNPGLRSRIAFHVPFADYNTEELCDIAGLIAKKKGLKLSGEACKRLTDVFETARKENGFGNGRYVRNVIEKAKMAQATRLMGMDFDLVKKDDVTTIRAEDIEMPYAKTAKNRTPIGF